MSSPAPSSLFLWLDHNHAFYWIMAGAATLGFLAWVLGPLRAEPGEETIGGKSKWAGAIWLLVLLLAWRWPFFFNPADFNPDESQIVAGAQVLTVDPVFWRSVDGSTAGPLDFYALLWVRLLGAPVDYFSARLTGLLLCWAALLLGYRTLRREGARTPARLALLPAALFFACATQDDFVHYSSEQASLPLLALAFWFLVGEPARTRWKTWIGGAALGLLPWAKLQTVPLAAGLGFWLVLQVIRNPATERLTKWRQVGELALAVLAPSLLIVGLVVATGTWENFLRSYVLQNFAYVAESHSAGRAYQRLSQTLNGNWHFHACFAGPVLASILSGILYRPRDPGRLRLAAPGLVLVLAAIAAVVIPGRSFSHYLLLLVFPLLVWTGARAGGLWQGLTTGRGRRWFVVAGLAIGGLLPLVARVRQPAPALIDQLADARAHPATAAGNILRALAQPGDRLAIWGWMCHFYVETGLYQATRNGHIYWATQASPQRDYYRQIYLADLRKNQPAFFVDAVGPGSFFYLLRPDAGHETFAPLGDYVRAHYTEIIDLEYARIYLRKDRVAGSRLEPAFLRSLAAAGRPVRDQARPEPVEIVRPDLKENTIGGRLVRMMLPPAQISWPLEGNERAFDFLCGYDPRAYTEGRGNGTVFTVELTTATGATTPIYYRLLDPSNNLADRGLVRERVILPPLSRGARLTLKTNAGPENNDVWDWAYLAGAAFERSPGYTHWQFPGFNRVPDAVHFDVSYLTEEHARLATVLHAPGDLVFTLHGGERTLALDFGYRAGAYENGGGTDGATFAVTVRPADHQPSITLLQKLIQPVEQPADRGNQHVDLVLPANVVAGDELIVSIDPGPRGDASWDWTYLANLHIE